MGSVSKFSHDKKGRTCTKCKRYKLWNYFHRSSACGALNSHASCCKVCFKVAHSPITTKHTCTLDMSLAARFLRYGFLA